ETGLMSIAGGKLTGYRKMAQRIVDLVQKKMEQKYDVALKECFTDKIVLQGGPFEGAEDVEAYTAKLKKEVISFGLDASYAQYLVANYGLQSNTIIEKLQSFNDTIEVALARAETWFCVHHELVIHPMDFFSRRSGRLYFNIDTIPPVMDAILDDFVQYFDWSKGYRTEMREAIEQALYESANFVYTENTAKG
ncbi:MAG: glycerol-3-phosphate dehydrogenase C-terminal domain-containing protein, partial [Bacteroidota bacterium]